MNHRLFPTSRLRNGPTLRALWLGLALAFALPSAARAQEEKEAAKPAPPAAAVQESPAPRGPSREQTYAIVVGAETYDSKKIPPVVGATAEAYGVADGLHAFAGIPPDQLTLLLSASVAAPTRRTILSALARLEGRLGPESLLIFSFTGRAAEANGHSYLLPTDASITHDPALLEETAIRADLLKSLIEATGAGQVIILLDTQRAAPGVALKPPLSVRPTARFMESFRFDLRRQRVTAFATIFAAQLGQVSLAHQKSGWGMFGWAVVKTLEQGAIRKYDRLLFPELFAAVSGMVARASSARQRPAGYVEEASPGSLPFDSQTEKVMSLFRSPDHLMKVYGFKGSRNHPSEFFPKHLPDNPPPHTYVSAYARRELMIAEEVAKTTRVFVPGLAAFNQMRWPPASELSQTVEGKHWELIRQSKDARDFKVFLNLYPRGANAAVARRAYEELRAANAPPITRFPTVRGPDSVKPGEEFGVTVQLTRALVTPGVKSDAPTRDVPLAAERGQTSWEVQVVLHADGFRVRDGRNTARLTLDKFKDSTKALFLLTPLRQAPPARRLEFEFWQHGTLVATATKEVRVGAAAVSPGVGRGGRGKGTGLPPLEPTLEPIRTLDGLSNGLPNTGAKVEADEVRRPTTPTTPTDFSSDKLSSPDLTIRIKHVSEASPDTFSVKVTSPHFEPGVELVEVFTKPPDHARWLKELYGRIAPLGARGAVNANSAETPDAARTRARQTMKDIGLDIFKRTPRTFQEGFWGVLDIVPGRFRSIQIIADDPLFPWELALPQRKRLNGESEERAWLGVEFQVARWPLERGDMIRPSARKSFALDKIYGIVPKYQGGATLPGQQKEARALAALGRYVSVPARLAELQKFFGDLPSGVIHFAGHGVVVASAQEFAQYHIQLEDDAVLTLEEWRGMTSNPRGNSPLIFFNACEVGDTSRVADFVNGWAPAALGAGAGGYIGTLWLIGDAGASEFGVEFYRALVAQARAGGNATVAQLLRETRERFLVTNDPTYLAYVYYGDHELVCLVEQPEVGARPTAPARER